MVALSTVLAGGAKKSLAPAEIVDALERAGAGGVVLDAGLDGARLEALERELQARPALPIVAIEAPCPRGPASAAMLASIDRDEADAALRAAEETMQLAGRLGARCVAIRLGELRALERDWTFARERFLRGQLDEGLALRLGEARDDSADRALDVARRAIDRLARAAESAGAKLCVRNGRRYTELPTARELDFLLADCAGAPVAPLYDVAAAHLADVMGFAPFALTAAAFAARAALVYAGDACGPIGALAPGRGLLDVRAAVAATPADALVAFSPWTGLTVDEVIEALPLVANAVDRRPRSHG
jgi:sugar phosphate isomerase/epimerase